MCNLDGLKQGNSHAGVSYLAQDATPASFITNWPLPAEDCLT